MDWLVRRACDLPASDVRLGFYDGVHGIAYVLDLLGYRSAALRLVDIAVEESWQRLGPDLSGGLAGIGLNLLHLAARTGDRELYGAALEAGRLAAEVLTQQGVARAGGGLSGTRGAGARGRAGLMHGASGPALLFLHLYEQDGHADWLQRAHAALRMDLACHASADPDGSAGRGGSAVGPAGRLADGGPGIGLVLRRYLTHHNDDEFRTRLAAIRERAATARFCTHAGLFDGRAGLALALADVADGFDAAGVADATVPGVSVSGSRVAAGARSVDAGALVGVAAAAGFWRPRPVLGSVSVSVSESESALEGESASARTPGAGSASGSGAGSVSREGPAVDQMRRLAWHAVGFRGRLAFPGDGSLRLSADLATGSAGVLLAVGAALGVESARLPFLGL